MLQVATVIFTQLLSCSVAQLPTRPGLGVDDRTYCSACAFMYDVALGVLGLCQSRQGQPHLMVHSWFMVHGSWFMVHGSWSSPLSPQPPQPLRQNEHTHLSPSPSPPPREAILDTFTSHMPRTTMHARRQMRTSMRMLHGGQYIYAMQYACRYRYPRTAQHSTAQRNSTSTTTP